MKMIRLLPLISVLVLTAQPTPAQEAYREFSDTLREQNEKGCDTSYVGGYVALYQSLTLLCNLRKDGAININDFNRYTNDVISVLASQERLQMSNIKAALEILNKKNLGILIARNKSGNVTGIISDGDLKRINYKSENINNKIVKKVMKKNPISVSENILAAEALSIMNNKKITVLCVYKKNRKKLTGLIHMHDILNANIA